MVLLVVTARSQAPYIIAGGVCLVSIIALPPRLWTAQLKRLGLLCLFLFITTAIFAGESFRQQREVSHHKNPVFSQIWATMLTEVLLRATNRGGEPPRSTEGASIPVLLNRQTVINVALKLLLLARDLAKAGLRICNASNARNT